MVNIIIPVYQAKDTLPDALNSLVAQTKKMFMVTIVQDGDKEDYSAIIDEYKRRGLTINLIYSPENKGPGVARQIGIDHNQMCDYIMFLDADDMLLPNAIDTLYGEAKRNGLDVLSSDFIAEQPNQSNNIMRSADVPVTWLHGKIYRAQYLKQNNIRFRDDLRMNEDSYFNLVAINSTVRKAKLAESTYLWRHNKKSVTREDGYMGFFHKSWEQYLYGQVKAVQEIIRITGDLEVYLFAATMINVYKWVMLAYYEQVDVTQAKNFMAELKQIPKIQELLTQSDFWIYISDNLHAAQHIEDKIIFNSRKFSDWINDWVRGEMVTQEEKENNAHIHSERGAGVGENDI